MSMCIDASNSRPANLENVFRGTFRVKKRDLPAKSGTVGRAQKRDGWQVRNSDLLYQYRSNFNNVGFQLCITF